MGVYFFLSFFLIFGYFQILNFGFWPKPCVEFYRDINHSKCLLPVLFKYNTLRERREMKLYSKIVIYVSPKTEKIGFITRVYWI